VLTVDCAILSSTAIRSWVLPSSRSALTFSASRASTIGPRMENFQSRCCSVGNRWEVIALGPDAAADDADQLEDHTSDLYQLPPMHYRFRYVNCNQLVVNMFLFYRHSELAPILSSRVGNQLAETPSRGSSRVIRTLPAAAAGRAAWDGQAATGQEIVAFATCRSLPVEGTDVGNRALG
jgi:hypothetical protein